MTDLARLRSQIEEIWKRHEHDEGNSRSQASRRQYPLSFYTRAHTDRATLLSLLDQITTGGAEARSGALEAEPSQKDLDDGVTALLESLPGFPDATPAWTRTEDLYAIVRAVLASKNYGAEQKREGE